MPRSPTLILAGDLSVVTPWRDGLERAGYRMATFETGVPSRPLGNGTAVPVLFGLTEPSRLEWERVQPDLRERFDVAMVLALPADAPASVWERALRSEADEMVTAAAGIHELVTRLERSVLASGRRARAEHSQERRRLTQQQIEAVSMIDMETGLFNRRYLLAKLRELLASARRYGRPVSLVAAHVQNHDELLLELGLETLLERYEELIDVMTVDLREADVAVRVSACTFGVLLPETGAEGGEFVRRRIADQMAQIELDPGFALEVATATVSSCASTASAAELLRAVEDATVRDIMAERAP